MTQEIRWDLALIAELANTADARSDKLLALRQEAIEAGGSGGRIIDLRLAVIAAEWSGQAAAALRRRRVLLASAETRLAGALGAIGPVEPAGWKPKLQSRSIDAVEQDLEAALQAGRAVAAAQLALELATANRNSLLMDPEPDLEAIGQLQRLIDYLAYELARDGASSAPDWSVVADSSQRISHLLDESWFRDVRRSDLLAVTEIIGGLDGAELDAVIVRLEDAHLYRWLREMDGIAGGNLSSGEQAELFRSIAQKAGAATIFRIASAERGGKFPEVSLAVSEWAPPAVAIEFIEICAAHAADSDLALTAALTGLAALRPAARIVAYTALVRTGSAETVSDATSAFLAAQIIERDDPVIVEFLEGVVAGLTGTAAALWNLSGAALVDSHQFREAWAGLGRTIALAAHDPIAFVAVVLDIDTLTKNPARWVGTTVTDLAAVGVSKVARLGRLGTAAQTIADWMRRFRGRSFDVGRLELEAGHLVTTLDRLHRATDTLAIREALGRLSHVEELTESLRRLPGEIPDLEITAALQLVRTLWETADSVVDEIAEALAA